MPDDVPVPIGPPGSPPIPLGCDSPACTAAKIEVVNAGNIIKIKCGAVDSAKGKRDVFAAIASVLAALAVTLFIASASAGTTAIVIGPIAIVPMLALFWAAVTVAATSILFWILAGIFEAQVLVLEGELSTARNNFVTAANRVTSSCPNSCWGDLTMPSC